MERYHIFKLGIAILFYAAYCIRPLMVDGLKIDNDNQTRKFDENDLVFYQGVQGKPGVDFPVLSHIPRTSFSCRNVDSGYYADLETDCQVFHICEEGKKISFLCPNGTIFQQAELICEWWFKVKCSESPDLYEESAEQLREENARRKAARRRTNHGAVMRTEEHSSVSASQNGRSFNVGKNVANKRVFNEENYKAPRNDLSKSSSTDFVRNRGSTRRKPVQFQQQASVNTEEGNRNQGNGRRQQQEQQFESSTTVSSNPQRFRFKTNQEPARRNDYQQKNNQNEAKFQSKLTDSSTSSSISQDRVLNLQSTKKSGRNQQSPIYYIKFTNDFSSGTTKSPISTTPTSYEDKQNQNDQNSIHRNQKPQKLTTKISFVSSTTEVPTTTYKLGNSEAVVPTYDYRQDRKISNSEVVDVESNKKHALGKESTVKQQSTVSLTRNDIVNKRLEPSDSDETQITQETASFYKNSYNSIDREKKFSTQNPYPNHRETYSDLKEPRYYSTKIFSAISSVTPQYITTQSINNGRPFVGSQVGTTYYSTTTSPTASTALNNLSNVRSTTNSAIPLPLSTASSFTSSTSKPRIETSTKRVVDHATVYGKFSTSSSTTPSSTRPTILLSKSLFNSGTSAPVQSSTGTPARSTILLSKSLFGGTTSSSFYLPTTPKTNLASSAEILTASDSYNRGHPQVRFFGKVQSSTKTPDRGFNSVNSTLKPSATTPTNTVSQKVNSLSTSTTSTTLKPGFFVTKNNGLDEVVRPRPFQLPPEPDFEGKAVYSTEKSLTSPRATFPTYKISSASPFSSISTLEPTQPTPFSTAKPNLPTTFDNVDSMINALAEMANQNTSRPGLVVPPSVGPQTLHTLAVYFANALDGIATDKNEDHQEENEENLTRVELEKKRVTELLTEMTMNRYNELFHEENATIETRTKSEDDDLEAQHSKGLRGEEPPKVRQLAKVFTQALSSYLDDPATFKKVLEEIRPTEPPLVDNEENTDLGDDELLNFSDADSKLSYPPFYPTPPAARPTWGYLLAYNNSQNLDVKNSINPDLENLQGADSQSFVSQFNRLREITTKSSLLPEDHWTSSPDVTKLWSSAFSFNPASINDNFGSTEPTVGTTEDSSSTLEPLEPHHEVKYELRALPKFELNSTQVHGILIDFMNTTKLDEDSRLQRILRKLNTTEDEFLAKMREIERNPLTRRLVLLLISECGTNTTQEVKTETVPLHSLLGRGVEGKDEILETASSGGQEEKTKKKSGFQIIDPSLTDDNQDARALQLLNSLYTIASRFGK